MSTAYPCICHCAVFWEHHRNHQRKISGLTRNSKSVHLTSVIKKNCIYGVYIYTHTHNNPN